jgi:hypothetical protein
MDAEGAAAMVRDCFALADKIMTALQTARLQPDDLLMVVGSDFYGGCWSAPGRSRRGVAAGPSAPVVVLAEGLQWLTDSR